jgi:hypothetical protein
MSTLHDKIVALRASLKFRQDVENAKATVQTKSIMSRSPLFAFGFALGFMALLSSLAVQPASATSVDLNATIGPILDSIIALIPSIINLIVAIVPAIIVLAIVGFIVGFLDKILQMLKL